MTYTFTRTGNEIEGIHDTVSDPSTNQSFTDAVGEIVTPKFTDIVYKASGGNSAVDNMIADFAADPLVYAVGTILSTGGTSWVYEDSTGPITEDNFRAFNALNVMDFGAEGDGIVDDYDSFLSMFDAGNRGGYCEFFLPAGKTFYTSQTIELPRPVYENQFRVSGYGSTMKTDQNIPIFQRRPNPDGTDAGSLISGYRPVIEGISFKGTSLASSRAVGQTGILLCCTYQASIRNCQFNNLDNGIIAAFALNDDFSNLRFTQCTDMPFCGRSGASIRSGVGLDEQLWVGATQSNSSFNANHLKNVRVFGSTSSESNFWCFAGDQNVWESCISEGLSTLYDFYYDYQSNTGVNQNTVREFWCESPNSKVNFKVRGKGNFTLDKVQRSHPAAFLDASGSSSSSYFIIRGQEYWGNMPTGSDPMNPQGRWFYHTNSNGYGEVDTNPGTGQGSSGSAFLFEDMFEVFGLSFFDRSRWSQGQLAYQGIEKLFTGGNGGYTLRSTSFLNIDTVNDSATVRIKKPVTFNSGQGIDNIWRLSSTLLDFGSIPANSTSTLTATVSGVSVGSGNAVICSPVNGDLDSGIILSHARVSGVDTVQITLANITSSPIATTNRNWAITVTKSK